MTISNRFAGTAGGLLMALALLLFGAGGQVAAAQEVLGPGAEACRPGAPGPAALVRTYGFKDRTGNLRVQLYSDDPIEFLESGKKLLRVEVPVTPAGDMSVCVPLPQMGSFAIVVLHDRDANGKLSIWSDGVGFSNNPKLALRKPQHEKVAFSAGSGVTLLDVVLNYRTGLLSVRPIARVED
jgi:uncharacterized protein (DUF2141 family)